MNVKIFRHDILDIVNYYLMDCKETVKCIKFLLHTYKYINIIMFVTYLYQSKYFRSIIYELTDEPVWIYCVGIWILIIDTFFFILYLASIFFMNKKPKAGCLYALGVVVCFTQASLKSVVAV